MPLIKPVALLNQSFSQRSAHCSHYSALKRYVWISPTPLLRPHLPPLLPFLFHTPSAVLSSSFWARPKKPAQQFPSQELPSPKLIQTTGTLWPIWGASILKWWREMEMVPPAIYSLPQFGLSDLLSTHPGNSAPCMHVNSNSALTSDMKETDVSLQTFLGIFVL